jgi:hypothetical protein
MPIVVLINRGLAWLVPKWVSGVWIVDQPFSENHIWNDLLTDSLKTEADKRDLTLCIPNSFQPCQLDIGELVEFTGIHPFPRDKWLNRLIERPIVTFMCRSDRTWPDTHSWPFLSHFLLRIPLLARICRRLGFYPLRDFQVRQQLHHISCLADEIRAIFPDIEFAVCGLDRRGKLPNSIKDMRVNHIDDDVNRAWTLQGARSHIVVGVLGSHTVVPGSLSGAYVELVPMSHLSNVLTTVPIRSAEVREALFTHRLIPADIQYKTLANILIEILLDFPYFSVAFADKYYHPVGQLEIGEISELLARRELFLKSMKVLPPAGMFN